MCDERLREPVGEEYLCGAEGASEEGEQLFAGCLEVWRSSRRDEAQGVGESRALMTYGGGVEV